MNDFERPLKSYTIDKFICENIQDQRLVLEWRNLEGEINAIVIPQSQGNILEGLLSEAGYVRQGTETGI